MGKNWVFSIIVILILLFGYLSLPLWYDNLPKSFKSEVLPNYFIDLSKLSIENSKKIAEMQDNRKENEIGY